METDPSSPAADAALDLEQAARQLELSPATTSWLRGVVRPVNVAGPILPTDAEANQLMERFELDPQDRTELLAARPDPYEHPALWCVLDRAYHAILATLGQPVPIEGFAGYPPLPAAAGAVGRFLPIWLYLALTPVTRQFHAGRGIPDEVTWDGLGEALRSSMRAHRTSTGLGGLGLWGFGWTLPLRFRGADFQLGKLAFNRGVISMSNGSCGHALAVHIPSEPPLDAAACDDSFAQARAFFTRHFPEEPVSFFTCESWLMDPQITEYLPETANLVGFQRRFTILPLTQQEADQPAGDESFERYVFGTSYGHLDEYPHDSTLRRAYVEHRKAGRHWHIRTGWFPADVLSR